MKFYVPGDHAAAKLLRSSLSFAGFYVVDTLRGGFRSMPTIKFDLVEGDVEAPTVDGVDSELERLAINTLAELSPGGRVTLQRAGGNQDDRALRVEVPHRQEEVEAAVVALTRAALLLLASKAGSDEKAPTLPVNPSLPPALPDAHKVPWWRWRWWMTWIAPPAVTALLLRLCAVALVTVTVATGTALAQTVSASGVITALNEAVTISDVGTYGAAGVQLTGACASGVVTFEASLDGTTWVSLEVFPVGSQTGVTTASAAGVWTANIGGTKALRARVSDACDTGNFTTTLRAGSGSARMFGSAAAGGTSQADNSALSSVTGGGGMFDTTPPAITDGNIGAFRMNSNRMLFAVPSDSQGDSAADDTNNAWRVNCVTGCSGSSFADNAAFTFGTTTVSISAGVLDDTLPNAATENSAAAPRISANRNWYFQLRDGAGNERGASVSAANALKVDGSAVTQPVSGTVTADARDGAGNALASDTAAPGGGERGLITRDIGIHVRTVGATAVGWQAMTGGTVSTSAPTYVTGNGEPISLQTDGDLRTAANVETIAAGDNNIGNVDIITVPAPLSTTGGGTEATALRVTLANDSTGVVSVDDNAGSLTIDGTVTVGTFPDNEPINLAQIAGTALAAPFDADSGVGTQSLAGVSLRKTASGGSVELGTSTDPVRVDPTGTTTQPVSAASLPLPTGAATSANQSTAITSLQLLDDAVKTDDAAFTPATDEVLMSGAEFDDTAPDSVDEGDAGALRMSANRNLYSTIRDAAGNERGVNVTAGNALVVDGSAVTQPVSGTVTVGTFPDNEPVNAAQWAGTAATGGNGASTAGSPRIVTAQDSGLCNPKDVSRVAVDVATSGNNELVALTAGQTIYVCDAVLFSAGTVAFQFVYGTGTACATGETDMTGPMDWVAQIGFAYNFEGRLKTAEANALCAELSAAIGVRGVITYRKIATF